MRKQENKGKEDNSRDVMVGLKEMRRTYTHTHTHVRCPNVCSLWCVSSACEASSAAVRFWQAPEHQVPLRRRCLARTPAGASSHLDGRACDSERRAARGCRAGSTGEVHGVVMWSG